MSYTPKSTSDAESEIRKQVEQLGEFFNKEVALNVKLTFYIAKPPSAPKKRKHPITRPDLDNYVKLVLDACNKYLWADDSQICHLVARKVYDVKPGILITVEPAVDIEKALG